MDYTITEIRIKSACMRTRLQNRRHPTHLQGRRKPVKPYPDLYAVTKQETVQVCNINVKH